MENHKLESIREDLHELVHIAANWVHTSQDHERELSKVVDRIVRKWTERGEEL